MCSPNRTTAPEAENGEGRGGLVYVHGEGRSKSIRRGDGGLAGRRGGEGEKKRGGEVETVGNFDFCPGMQRGELGEEEDLSCFSEDVKLCAGFVGSTYFLFLTQLRREFLGNP